MHGVFATTAITALTAQNTLGVKEIYSLSNDFLAQQLDCVFEDIYPDAIKIGMLESQEVIEVVANKLKEHQAKNVVLDPVMVSTSGSVLLKESAIEVLKTKLFPLSLLLTPNVYEAQILGECEISSTQSQKECAREISKRYGVNVLLKGGHIEGEAFDFLVCESGEYGFQSEKINNPNTHGTGCTLSSAIASNLALGFDLIESVQRAKKYLSGAISACLNLGKGRGPINHLYTLQGQE